MNRVTVKALSVTLILAMSLSAASCGKKSGSTKSRSGETIKADSPWFNTKTIHFDPELDGTKEVDRITQRLLGIEDNRMLILTSGSYEYPEMEFINYDEINGNDYDIETVTVIDRNTGGTIQILDLTEDLEPNTHLCGTEYSFGKITSKYACYSEEDEDFIYFSRDFDPLTGELTGTEKHADFDDIDPEVYKIGGHLIRTESIWNEEYTAAYYHLHITSPDGSERTVEIKDANNEDLNIYTIMAKDENTAVIPVEKERECIYYELDLKTLALSSDKSDEYNWLNEKSIDYSVTGTDGKTYFLADRGIYVINFKDKSIDEFFNYSWCGVGNSTLSELQIAEISKDSFVLIGDDWSYNEFSDPYRSNFTIIEFTRADTNPHAGKKILELCQGDIESIDVAVSDAIIEFNESNTEYYIEVTDRYNYDYTDWTISSADEQSAFLQDINSEMSTRRAMDLINGEGPDILINASQYGQLNNPEYLTDLTPYLSDIDSEKYFTNIIDSAKVDGKLYNLPISFYVEGIITDSENAGSSGKGFTIPEYENFLNNTLNGKDVIDNGQSYYFVKLFNNMSDKFISDGKADFTVPEFAELADFVKNNVPVDSELWGAYIDPNVEDPFLTRNRDAALYSCYGSFSYMIEIAEMTGSSDILGIPSTDGRGPSANANLSVAVSAKACNVDACVEFAKILLSDDIQELIASDDLLVINRTIFRQQGEAAVEYINGDGYWAVFGWEGEDPNPTRLFFSEQNIDVLENIILSCSNMPYSDAAINTILIEEMPAYFLGQKDLDSVVKIAQDRVQKALDERK